MEFMTFTTMIASEESSYD